MRELQDKVEERFILTKQFVLEAAIENAEKALGRRPVKVSRKIGHNYEMVDVYMYEGQAANAALKMLGNEIGMFGDRKDVRIVNEYDKMTDAELAQHLTEAAQRLLAGPVIENEGGDLVGGL
jgi:hypothetical protein